MLSQYEQLRRDIDAAAVHGSSSYPMRFHGDVELQYVAEGFLEMTVDGKPVRVEEGELCVVFPNVLHSITAQNCRKYLLTVNPTVVSALRDILTQKRPVDPVLRKGNVPEVTAAMLGRCVDLCGTGENPVALLAYATAVLSELIPMLSLTDRNSAAEPVQRIVEFILTNYTQDISLDQMSRALGYSKYHISHLVGSTFGCNFRTLLNNYRVHAARAMLRHTGKSIGQILYDCGFQTQSAFNRAFLRSCGMTPMQYRTMSGVHGGEIPGSDKK